MSACAFETISRGATAVDPRFGPNLTPRDLNGCTVVERRFELPRMPAGSDVAAATRVPLVRLGLVRVDDPASCRHGYLNRDESRTIRLRLVGDEAFDGEEPLSRCQP